MTEKKRPIEERIAQMFGRTSYCDLKEAGSTGMPTFTVPEIAAAVGVVATRCGKLAVMALEAAYASTPAHDEALLRAWEDYRKPAPDQLVLVRWGGGLAALELRGQRVSSTVIGTLSYRCDLGRRGNLADEINAAYRWMAEHRDCALVELRRVVRDDEAMFHVRESLKKRRRSAA